MENLVKNCFGGDRRVRGGEIEKCQQLTGSLRTPWNSILVCLRKRANLCGLSCSDYEIHCSFYDQEILNLLCLVHVCYTPKMAEYYCKLESQ